MAPPPPDAALLEVKDLAVGYGRTPVLRGVSLRLEAGQCIGLIGPNGHGKTTLLRSISGLLPAWSGEVLLGGEAITRSTPRAIVERGLVHVPQGNALFPQMTVLENLELGAYARRARDRRKESLERVFLLFPRLAERRRQACRSLSGGERQMVSIGVGLMSIPRILMLDEPTLGLSPKLKSELCAAIGAIAGQGIPIVLVEQDVEFMLTLSDHFYLVNQGRVAAEFSAGQQLDQARIMEMYFGLH